MYDFQKFFLVKGSKSDKLHHHGYHRIYPWFLEHFRKQEVTLLEIGIEKTESLKLWDGYFKNLTLHGIDIDAKNFENPNITLHKVDQSKPKELESFVTKVGTTFDIIVDDGSHVPEHQILTLDYIWALLKPGGVYIIEDIETSYWGKSKIYGYKFNSNSINVIQYLKNLIDFVNIEFSGKKIKHKKNRDINEEIEMITFAYNCVILIKKDYDSFTNLYNRNYRFPKKINQRAFRRYPSRVIKRFRSLFKI